MPIDRILGDHCQELAVVLGQRAHGMNVAATEPIAYAVEPRAVPD